MGESPSRDEVSSSIEMAGGDQEKPMLGQMPLPAQLHDKPVPPTHPLDSVNSKSERRKQGYDPFKHLSEQEAAILKRQLDISATKVSYRDLFRYATKIDLVIMVLSAICSIAGGAAQPLMTVIFSSLAGVFQGFFLGTVTGNFFSHELSRLTPYFVYLAVGEFVTIYIATIGFIYTGEHVSAKIREQYLKSILRQNIGYFDKLGAGEITTRITSNTNLIQDGISQKVGLTLTALATLISAYVIGYMKYWKLTLILTSTIVAIFLTMAALGRFVVKFNKRSLASYAEGGTVAEETISSIRNATAFGTQDKLAKEYGKHLTVAEKSGFRMKIIAGLMPGFFMTYMYFTYALAFWLGGRYIVAGECALSDVLTIVLSMMIAASALGNVAPNIQAFATAIAAASEIYATIDRLSPLDPTVEEGKKLDYLEGTVELRHVKHIYPSRPEVTVMEDIELIIPASRTTALVGASGSGKSTIISLVERFYDPVDGEVLLDGVNVQEFNLRWLRQQSSLVSQEPMLFATTIAGNIEHGLIGTDHEHLPGEQIRKLVENAAKMANAHDFICQLPERYETHVGERGFLLSGGQKQRIAIARAVVSNPKILLLDEATSALDTKSEGIVQAALDKVAKGRTTIVIAHRLSTIKGADNIVVMSQGRIVEQGAHNALLEKKGAYYNLVEAQTIAQESEEKQEDDPYLSEVKDGKLKTPDLKNGKEYYEVDINDPELGHTKTGQSASSKTLANKKEQASHYSSFLGLLKFVASFNKQEWHYMLLGLVCAIIAGAGLPVQSVFFAKSITALSQPPTRYGYLLSQTNFWSWMYFMLALTQLLSFGVMGVSFAYCSERLVHRARDMSFRSILRQDVVFFDREENSPGALTSFLSSETTNLAGMSGVTLGTILQLITTLIVGFIVALAIGWKLALVCIATVPVVLSCGYLRVWMLARFQARSKRAYERSASYACEAISAMRTVASLTRENDVWRHYHQQIVDQGAKSLRSVLKSSLLYAASQSFTFLCMALSFWYGGTLIGRGEYTLFQFFLCFSAIIFSAQSGGTIFSFAADMGKAKHAATEMRALFNRKPKIDTWSLDGETVDSISGDIEFHNVHFRYPTRPEQPVLQGLDLQVRPGQYVALVGASGCGKSTTIAMLERFYDPIVGSVFVDGKDISSLNVNTYRKHLALVSQEPTLYQGTIGENILLGTDKTEEVSEDSIIKACKDANIYEFILSLPESFNTIVGGKGSMLSGGQKQRVAIARALLRDPKILLLDEATSALDSESEKVVQRALDKAAKGRTTIAVAHRLSTIQNADIIYVFDRGRIVEKGKHSELLAKRGRYYELVNLQSLGKTQ